MLLNLLRYQAARNTNWVTQKNVLEPTEAALERAIRDAAGDKELAMELIRHLLVYTLRAHRHEEWRRREEEKKAKKREKHEARGARP